MKLLLLDLKLKAVREVRPGEKGYVGVFVVVVLVFF